MRTRFEHGRPRDYSIADFAWITRSLYANPIDLGAYSGHNRVQDAKQN
jgi:hypothetical protein